MDAFTAVTITPVVLPR